MITSLCLQYPIKNNHAFYAIISSDEVTTGHMDLTGRFPNNSSTGKEYAIIGYNYDTNYIMGVTLQNRKGENITEAWKSVNKKFKHACGAP